MCQEFVNVIEFYNNVFIHECRAHLCVAPDLRYVLKIKIKQKERKNASSTLHSLLYIYKCKRTHSRARKKSFHIVCNNVSYFFFGGGAVQRRAPPT
jgi:hypothetical protein